MAHTIIHSTPNVVYGRLSLPETLLIEKACRKRLLKTTEQGEVGGDGDIDLDSRKSTISWLKNKSSRKILDNLVQEINDEYFEENINDLTDEYQVTLYDNVEDHYDWHQDFYEADGPDEYGFCRQLSISLCLSSSEFYDGAELFVEDGSKTNIRVYRMQYGDFCIFPAVTEHRVNSLRSGERLSLVSWYGYYE